MARCSRRALIDILNSLLVVAIRPVNHTPGKLLVTAEPDRLRLTASDLLCSATLDLPATGDGCWQVMVQHGELLRIVQDADGETVELTPLRGGDHLQASGKRVSKRCSCTLLSIGEPVAIAQADEPQATERILCSVPAGTYAAALYRIVPSVANSMPPGVIHNFSTDGLDLVEMSDISLVRITVLGAKTASLGEPLLPAIAPSSAAILSEILKPAAARHAEVQLALGSGETRLVVRGPGLFAAATIISRSCRPVQPLYSALVDEVGIEGMSRILFERQEFERRIAHPHRYGGSFHTDWGPQLTWIIRKGRDGSILWGPARATEIDMLRIQLDGPPVQASFHFNHIWSALRAIDTERAVLHVPWTPANPYILSPESGRDRALFGDGSAEMRQVWKERAGQVEPVGPLSWHELAAALWNPESPLVHNRMLHHSLRGYINKTDPVGSVPHEVRAWGLAVSGVENIQALLLRLLTHTGLFEVMEDGSKLVVGAPHELMDWAPFRLATLGGDPATPVDRFWATILSGQMELGLNGLEIALDGLPSAERIGIMIILYEHLRKTNTEWPSLVLLDQTCERGQYTLIAGYPLGYELMMPSSTTPVQIGEWFDTLGVEPSEQCMFWFPHSL